MNIQQFYQKSAVISLNASMAALIPPFFLIILGILILPNRVYILVIIPFLFYSFFCYQSFLLNKRRSMEVSNTIERKIPSTLWQANEVVLAFLPAPSLRLIIFNEDGIQIGEVKDMKFQPSKWFIPTVLDKHLEKKYGIYDEFNQLTAFFLFKKKKIIIQIKDDSCKHIIIKKSLQNQTNSFFIDNDKRLEIKQSSLYIDYQIYHNKKMISRLRKGWLPLEWGRVFKDPNTPVLLIEGTLNQNDRLVIYAIMSHYLRYSDH